MITKLAIETHGNNKDIQSIFATDDVSDWWVVAKNSPVERETMRLSKGEYFQAYDKRDGMGLLIREGYLKEVPNKAEKAGK
jgi:hypothetical protein